MSFSNKVVIVTGAGAGIGAATTVMFCKEGASVVMVDKNEESLNETAAKCFKIEGKYITVTADVSNDNDAHRIIEETINTFGKLDILVNNAGVMGYGTILDGKILESFDKILPVNLRAVICLTSLAAPHLVATKGNVVNLSSVAGQIASTPMAYSVSKAGVNHFTRVAAKELASSGVRVNAVCPGPVRTNLYQNCGIQKTLELSSLPTPLGRLCEPEEISDLILYVAGVKAKGITGSILTSDNGYLLK